MCHPLVYCTRSVSRLRTHQRMSTRYPSARAPQITHPLRISTRRDGSWELSDRQGVKFCRHVKIYTIPGQSGLTRKMKRTWWWKSRRRETKMLLVLNAISDRKAAGGGWNLLEPALETSPKPRVECRLQLYAKS